MKHKEKLPIKVCPGCYSDDFRLFKSKIAGEFVNTFYCNRCQKYGLEDELVKELK